MIINTFPIDIFLLSEIVHASTANSDVCILVHTVKAIRLITGNNLVKKNITLLLIPHQML